MAYTSSSNRYHYSKLFPVFARNGSSTGNNKNHNKNKTLKHNKISARVKIVMLVFDIGRDISTMQIFKHEFQHNRYITGTLGLGLSTFYTSKTITFILSNL